MMPLVPVSVPIIMLMYYGMYRYDFYLQSDRISGDGEIEWRPTGLTTPASRPANLRTVYPGTAYPRTALSPRIPLAA